jgi:hypothetical protein
MREEMIPFQNYLLDYFCDWVNREKINHRGIHNANCVFGTRIQGPEQLQEGKWFLGDDNYICVSLSNLPGGPGVSSIRLFLAMGVHGDITRLQLEMSRNPGNLEHDLEQILINRASEFGLVYHRLNRFYVRNLEEDTNRYPRDPNGLKISLDRMTSMVIPFLNQYLREKNYHDIYIPIDTMRERLRLVEPYRPGTLNRAGF